MSPDQEKNAKSEMNCDILSDENKSEYTSSEDEKQVQVILMAKTYSSSKSEYNNLEHKVNPSHSELFDKYKEMLREFEKLY